MANNEAVMETTKKRIQSAFADLDKRIRKINSERRVEGLIPVPMSRIRLLGQISLLVHDEVSAFLALAQTGDLDAFLDMSYVVKVELKKSLLKQGLIYDEDSPMIWIPSGAKYEKIFSFESVVVEAIDPESALVSKAVKAPEKNRQLIRQAIASGKFGTLVDRILKNGGKLEDFA